MISSQVYIQEIMLNTLVSIVNEYMGSKWALFMPNVNSTGIIEG